MSAYTAKSDKALQRAINRFEYASDEKAFQGSIPVGSNDLEEQEYLDNIHNAIDTEYVRSRELLEALIQRRVRGE